MDNKEGSKEIEEAKWWTSYCTTTTLLSTVDMDQWVHTEQR